MAKLIVNFGGPRKDEEIFPFLQTLLCDRDVVRTKFPSFFHNYLFTRIARKRASKIKEDYDLIGGKSPIFADTEYVRERLEQSFGSNVLAFHRYLPATHLETLKQIENAPDEEIQVIPLFPQFTYATTGSIARFFSQNLSKRSLNKLRWIRSYPDHPLFIQAFQTKIKDFLKSMYLNEKEVFFLFSAHGLPQTFIETGDPYREECERSFHAIMKAFPEGSGKLCFQSKFGKGEWLKPYTEATSRNIRDFSEERTHIVFIPISFTSDHIETLFEIEYQYLPLIRKNKLMAYRCPSLNREDYWLNALSAIASDKELFQTKNNELIYQ